MPYPDYINVNGQLMEHPLNIKETEWKDDLKTWPRTEAPHVVSYLVESKACDLNEMKAYRSLESYNYLHSGWVGQVLIYNVNKTLCLLKCDVTPSQNLSKDPHTAWICANYTGEVLTAGCTCMAGLGKACSHVGAVLWKIDMGNRLGLTGESCTDKSAAWNRGTKRNIEPALLKDISFKKPKVNAEMSITDQTETTLEKHHSIKQFYSQTEVLNHVESSGLGDLLSTPGTIFYNIGQAKAVHLNIPSSNNRVSLHDHTMSSTLPGSCGPCLFFYEKYIKVTLEQQIALKEQTISQAASKKTLWESSRRVRLTASTANSVPKRNTTSPENFLRTKLYKPFKGDENTMYGSEMESIARERFVSIYGFNVQLCGTVVSQENNWLSASPDGLIGSKYILEIKCPRPEKFVPKKVDLILDENQELKLNPKGSRGYYTQVQIAMYCTNTDGCYFYVFLNGKDDKMVFCEYDPKYVTTLLSRLRDFYFLHFLPRMEEDDNKGILNLSPTYKLFMLKKGPIVNLEFFS